MLRGSVYQVKILCSKTVYESMEEFKEADQFEWWVQKDGESLPEFLDKNAAVFQSCDLVFITTMLSNFKAFYKVSKNNKTVLLVHNANSFLAPDQYLFFENPVSDRLRFLRLYFNRAHFYKKRMLESLTGLAFPTETILNYVREKFTLPVHLKLINLPFAFAEQRRKLQTETTTITIPCTVNSAIRDYKSVLDAFLKLQDTLTEKIRLVLLGQPKGDGKQIIDAFLSLEQRKIEVIYYKELIPNKEYQRQLLATHFLILPLRKFGRNHIYKERLGYSKISGGVNDMIRFMIPALIPNHYPLTSSLKAKSETYEEGKLFEKLEEWIREKRFLTLEKENNSGRLEYDRAFIKEQFLNHIGIED